MLKAIVSLLLAIQLSDSSQQPFSQQLPAEQAISQQPFEHQLFGQATVVGSEDAVFFQPQAGPKYGLATSPLDPPLAQLPPSVMASVDELDETPVPKFKKRALQKISFSGGWLAATGGNDLSSTFASAGVTLGMPLGSMENLLAVTPSFRTDWIDASSAIEVPSTLFDVSLDLFHTRRLNDRWKALAMIRPSHRSDFKTTDNAIRVFGLGLLIWDYLPERLSVNFGAVYLGRSDITALPAVGLTWTPNTRNRFELQFPRTRLFHRLRKDGPNSELWSYLTLGIGGNTWAVTRANGSADEVALRDLRLTTGLEKVISGGGGWFLETGLAVDRSIEYLSSPASKVSLSNGIIISAGWVY